MKLLHTVGRRDNLKNFRAIATIGRCDMKQCVLMAMEGINELTEDNGLLGEVQGGLKRGRRTEDNLFMLERLIEMVKVRNKELFGSFVDRQKAYD